MSVAGYVPDLMDRSRITAAAPGAVFVQTPDALLATDATTVVVDLGRPGVLEVVPRLAGRRVVGFGSHVDADLLEAARAAGCTEVLRRSEFFRRVGELVADPAASDT